MTAPTISQPSVNAALHPTDRPDGHPHRVVETDSYAAFARRIARAYGRRVGEGDIEGLAGLCDFAVQVDIAISRAVLGLREFGYSWSEIAARLGVTRQAAQQRWGGEPS